MSRAAVRPYSTAAAIVTAPPAASARQSVDGNNSLVRVAAGATDGVIRDRGGDEELPFGRGLRLVIDRNCLMLSDFQLRGWQPGGEPQICHGGPISYCL